LSLLALDKTNNCIITIEVIMKHLHLVLYPHTQRERERERATHLGQYIPIIKLSRNVINLIDPEFLH